MEKDILVYRDNNNKGITEHFHQKQVKPEDKGVIFYNAAGGGETTVGLEFLFHQKYH